MPAKTAKTICFCNQKGGVGKTTSTMLVADGLQRTGDEVLIIDTDPQGSARNWESGSNAAYPRYPVRVEHQSDLGEDEFLAWLKPRLKSTRDPLREQEIDWVLIDTPSSLKSIELAASLKITDYAIIPTFPHLMSIEALVGLFDMMATTNAHRREKGREPLHPFIMVTMYDKRISSQREFFDYLPGLVQEWNDGPKDIQITVMDSLFTHSSTLADVSNFQTSIFSLKHSSGTKRARTQLASVIKEVRG